MVGDGELSEPLRSGGGAHVVPFPSSAPSRVTFNRQELTAILNVYGRRVAEGEWRDYAISFTRDKAVFSIFRRHSEMPLFRVEKDPRLARRQGAYAVIATPGVIVKRGHDLDQVLRVFDKPLRLVRE